MAQFLSIIDGAKESDNENCIVINKSLSENVGGWSDPEPGDCRVSVGIVDMCRFAQASNMRTTEECHIFSLVRMSRGMRSFGLSLPQTYGGLNFLLKFLFRKEVDRVAQELKSTRRLARRERSSNPICDLHGHTGDAWDEKNFISSGELGKKKNQEFWAQDAVGDEKHVGPCAGHCDEIHCDPQVCLRAPLFSRRIQWVGSRSSECNSRGICDAGLEMWAVLSTVEVARVANGSSSMQHKAA